MSRDWLLSALYLYKMSHMTMFPTSHLSTMRTRNQEKIRYIFVLYGHILVTSRVPLRLCSLLIFRKVLLLINISFHLRFFPLFFCFLLWFPNSSVLSPSFFLKVEIFLSFLSPLHCIIMTQYVFQLFPSLIYHAKISRSLWMLIFFRVISKSQFTKDFFCIILC